VKSLYLRIWLTVVAALALFALVSGWMWQRHLEQERARAEQVVSERLAAWAELVQRSLPSADSPQAHQAEALVEWSARLRVPMALDDALGQRIATSESFRRREAMSGGMPPSTSVRLDDGRTLWLARRILRRGGPEGLGGLFGGAGAEPWFGRLPPDLRLEGPGPALRLPGAGPDGPATLRLGVGPGEGGPVAGAMVGGGFGGAPGGSPGGPPDGSRRMFGPSRDLGGPARPGEPLSGMPPLLWGLPGAVGPLVLVALLFVAVAAGAYPVVRRLTRRLEALKQGVAAFGAGDLGQRVDDNGRDEVAAVAATFNRTAERIETLVQSHKRLLANASHELRSPLARLKMAVAMLGDAAPGQREHLQREIHTNIAELDALVEEVLLASRLDGGRAVDRSEPVDLLGIAAEEAARVGAEVAVAGDPGQCTVAGSERLLRRALRNLLENARRYGGEEVQLQLQPDAEGLKLRVSDRGPGVPAEFRERIFEPYFRLPGHAEREGGVGLGLALVRQIAQAHGGQVRCSPRDGGGTVFELSLPRQA